MMKKTFAALAACMASLLLAGSAHAGVIDLGIGGANVFTSGNFKGSNNGTAGAVVAGGNVNLTSFALNRNNQTAYNGYALVAGGSLTMSNGSLNNGMVYAGAGTALSQNVGKNGVSNSAVLPLTFSATAAHALAVSSQLDTLGATGSFKSQYGGLYLTGSGRSLEVFDLSANDLTGAGWLNVSGIGNGATVIVNVSGAANGVIKSLGDFGSTANVLYNFVDAVKLDFSSIDLKGSMLAPNATITGGNGQIGGNVVAGAWDSQLTLTGQNYFRNVDAKGFELDAAASAVPEPSTLLLVALGLSAVAFSARRHSLRSKP